MPGFTAADIPALEGRTAIVTGANSGIGLEAARALAAKGATVILAVRDPAKGQRAAASINEQGVGRQSSGGQAEVRQLDLASLESVRAFAQAWGGAPVDLLINNAGVMVPPLSRTADGFELQFGTNHLGHFALTNLLLPAITQRVVTIASGVHLIGRIDFGDLNWERRRYRRWAAYAQSKLANLLFTSELQRRLAEAGSPVLAAAAHPGYAATNLQSHSGSGLLDLAMGQFGNRFLAQSAAGGALPTLYAAVADIPGGSYVGPGGLSGRGAPKIVGRSKAARDGAAARRLWTVSEELTGIGFPEIPRPLSGIRNRGDPALFRREHSAGLQLTGEH